MSVLNKTNFGNTRKNISEYSEELLPRLLFLSSLFLFWYGLTYTITPRLPTPNMVAAEASSILASGDFLYHMYHTFRRVFISFFAIWIVSIVIGLVMGLSDFGEKFFDMGIIIGLTVPGIALSIIGVMLFGLNEIAAHSIIFIAAVPLVTLSFWEGVKDIDASLIQMSNSFGFSRLKTIKHVIIPQLSPYMLSAGRLGLSISWKVCVIVEFLGFGNGIGYMLTLEYSRLNMSAVLAWTALFTIIMLFIEYGVFKTLERRYLGWRKSFDIQGGIA